jgi:UDPglucose--hexose-1-phosphate uridylyltransferase
MPEFRRDPTTGAWTILAVERARRPGGERLRSAPLAEADYLATCPFCLGNERETPPEVLRIPAGAVRWSVRVVPNKYPALLPDAGGSSVAAGSLFQRRPARGRHEVIVEGPTHRSSAAPPEAHVLRDVFVAARERCRAFSRDRGVRHVALFKNHGRAGGASLTHPHWQLVASPVVPPAVERELAIAAQYRKTHGRAVLDHLLRRELRSGARLVEATDEFAVLAAYAPQWMGETWVVPRAPGASVGALDDPGLEAFATVLWRTLRRVARALEEPPLNVVIHSAPLHQPAGDAFRWHARIQPRLGTQAGFELGSGVAIVTLAPETAARVLRHQTV